MPHAADRYRLAPRRSPATEGRPRRGGAPDHRLDERQGQGAAGRAGRRGARGGGRGADGGARPARPFVAVATWPEPDGQRRAAAAAGGRRRLAARRRGGPGRPDRVRAARRRRPEVAERPRVRRRREARRPAGGDDDRRRSGHLGGGGHRDQRQLATRGDAARDRGRRHLAGRPGRCGRSIASTLLAALLDELDAELVALEAGRSPLARYRDACTTLGSDVAVETSTGRLTGRAVEVDPHGALVVDTGSGLVALATGEVVRLRPGAPA